VNRRFLLSTGIAAGLVRPTRAETGSFGRGSWQALLDAHAQRPLIVHFWGLTCGPCLAELPAWGAFARSRPKADLVLVAADPVPEPADRIAATLTQAGLSGAESWSFDGRFPSRLYFEVDPSWAGELPRTVLRGIGGTQESWIGTADFSRVTAWLNSQKA
jgi:thiol-disulfide isomerase/thioredoxin